MKPLESLAMGWSIQKKRQLQDGNGKMAMARWQLQDGNGKMAMSMAMSMARWQWQDSNDSNGKMASPAWEERGEEFTNGYSLIKRMGCCDTWKRCYDTWIKRNRLICIHVYMHTFIYHCRSKMIHLRFHVRAPLCLWVRNPPIQNSFDFCWLFAPVLHCASCAFRVRPQVVFVSALDWVRGLCQFSDFTNGTEQISGTVITSCNLDLPDST